MLARSQYWFYQDMEDSGDLLHLGLGVFHLGLGVFAPRIKRLDIAHYEDYLNACVDYLNAQIERTYWMEVAANPIYAYAVT